MEAALAEKGEPSEAPEGSLRWIAHKLLIRAGTDTVAAREIGDRLDGKPAQGVELAGPNGGPLQAALSVTFVKPGEEK